MEKCVVARHMNGIKLNDYEFLHDDAEDIRVFKNKENAIKFLTKQGFSEEDIEFLGFYNYEQLKKGIYEEI